jgi:hypothetical protein
MNKYSMLATAALALGGASAHAQSDKPGSTLPDSTRSPNESNSVVLTPNAPHATTSEATGNTRITVGTTLIEQQDMTLSTPNLSQAPAR